MKGKTEVLAAAGPPQKKEPPVELLVHRHRDEFQADTAQWPARYITHNATAGAVGWPFVCDESLHTEGGSSQ